MASAARFAPATSSEASSNVKLGSWLITDMTMLIITCKRRIFLASCSRSADSPVRSRLSIRLPNLTCALPARLDEHQHIDVAPRSALILAAINQRSNCHTVNDFGYRRGYLRPLD